MTKTTRQLLLAAPLAGMLAGCASTMTAQQSADYDGDGYISDAEYKQFQKQKNVEDRAVYSESVKRRNAANTVRDVNDVVWGTRSIVRGVQSF